MFKSLAFLLVAVLLVKSSISGTSVSRQISGQERQVLTLASNNERPKRHNQTNTPLPQGSSQTTTHEYQTHTSGGRRALYAHREAIPKYGTSVSIQTSNYPDAGINAVIGRLVSLSQEPQNVTPKLRNERSAAGQDLNPDCEYTVSHKPVVHGIRADNIEVTDEGAIIVKAFEPTQMYLIGRNLYSNLSVALTPTEGAQQDDCTHTDRVKSLQIISIDSNIAQIVIDMPSPGPKTALYFCLREAGETAGWFHQGSEVWLKLYIHADLMPLYMKIITIVCLLGLSGLFSGLNLGLMSLDKNELLVIMRCGNADEQRYARAIAPVRRRGNYLLCSILFSNTLVNSTISVLLEELSGGTVAVMTSTVLIVMFGEILPQAFCSRHGLAVGAKTVLLTRLCMILTFPLSYPVSRCLDWALGEELGHAYDRERLMEFIKVTRDINNLESDEVDIITGALKIKTIPIADIMTKIRDVYMLDETSVLDFDTIQSIVEHGYSRIPVYEAGNKENIIAVMLAKDLALVDPDDKTPVQTMINFNSLQPIPLYEDMTVHEALQEFKKGTSHMAIVQRICNDGDKDPYPEVTGIVTLEDVIEEIMGMEITDETDISLDNRGRERRKDNRVKRTRLTGLNTGDLGLNVITPQLRLASYQFLVTTVEPFSPKYISDSTFKRLLSQRIFHRVKEDDPQVQKRLYTAGQPADYFIMILEGRVHVSCGKENLIFDGGPFNYFGKAALVGPYKRLDGKYVGQDSSVGSGNTTGKKESTTRVPLLRRESLAKLTLGQLSLAKKTDVVHVEQPELPGIGMATSSLNGELSGPSENFFIPDYTVDIITNTCYLKITYKDYQIGLKATRIERGELSALTESGLYNATSTGMTVLSIEEPKTDAHDP